MERPKSPLHASGAVALALSLSLALSLALSWVLAAGCESRDGEDDPVGGSAGQTRGVVVIPHCDGESCGSCRFEHTSNCTRCTQLCTSPFASADCFATCSSICSRPPPCSHLCGDDPLCEDRDLDFAEQGTPNPEIESACTAYLDHRVECTGGDPAAERATRQPYCQRWATVFARDAALRGFRCEAQLACAASNAGCSSTNHAELGAWYCAKTSEFGDDTCDTAVRADLDSLGYLASESAIDALMRCEDDREPEGDFTRCVRRWRDFMQALDL